MERRKTTMTRREMLMNTNRFLKGAVGISFLAACGVTPDGSATSTPAASPTAAPEATAAGLPTNVPLATAAPEATSAGFHPTDAPEAVMATAAPTKQVDATPQPTPDAKPTQAASAEIEETGPKIYLGFAIEPFSPEAVNKLETDIGLEYPIHSEFTAWEYDQLPQVLDDIKKTGKTPLITWEAWEPNGEVEQPKYSLKSILAGEHDDFIRKNAQIARDFGEAMFMRLFHEGNGNWYPWAVGVNGNTAEDYVEAWAYIRKIFKEEKADNVTFVWSPNAEDVGKAKMEQIKPREEDYDWAAIDGYNWGTTQKKATAGYDSQWQEFADIMQGPYQRLMKITKKPFMVAETGTVAEGGDKAEWIKQMFAVLPKEFMNIFAVVYFNINKEQGGANVQLRIDEQPEVLAAFKKAIENPIFDRNRVKIADNKIVPLRAAA